MVGEWEELELKKLVDISTDKVELATVEAENYISTDNMLPNFGGIDFNLNKPSVSKTSRFQKDEILFSNIRTYFRKLWLAERNGACSNDVIVFRPRSHTSPRFLFYSLMDERFIEHTVQTSKGTKMPRGDKNAILKYIAKLPPLPEQKAIAHVLGALDDKIELNRRMNETLEGMAQALFKSWFVDFDPVIDNALAAGNPIPEPLTQRAETRRQTIANGTANCETAQVFPASFRFTEELGWIPEGWGVKEANEAADISIGKTPPRKQQEWFSEISSGNIVWVSIKDMGTCGVFINDSSEYLTSESIEKFNVKVVPKGSVILSFKLTVGRVAIADTSLATNEAIAHFTDLKNGLTREFIYSYLKQFDYNDLGSTSSIATAVNSKIIKAMPVLIPHVQVLAAFSKTCQKWFGLIHNQQYQSQTLAKLRDVLLPKLISGELRIPQAEKMVKEAIT